MPSKHDWRIHHVSVVALLFSVGLGPHPSCSVAALALLVVHRHLDCYFHHSFFDEHARVIKQLQADFAKIKTKQSEADLKTAFRTPGAQA